MIFEHLETGLRVRVVAESDEHLVVFGNGRTEPIRGRVVHKTDSGQPVRLGHDGKTCFVYTDREIATLHLVGQ